MADLYRIFGSKKIQGSSLRIQLNNIPLHCMGPRGTTICQMIIRIFNGCEVQIENSVTRVTVRHHEARRVIANSTRVTEFSICTEQSLQILFLAHSSFENCK